MAQFGWVSNLFSSGQLPVVISDSDYVLRKFDEVGFDSLPLSRLCSEADCVPNEILLVTVNPSKIPSPDHLARVMGHSAALLAPLLSFCANRRSIDYFFSRLREIDFVAACSRSRRRLEQLQHQSTPLLISSLGCELSIELGDNLEVFAPKVEPIINPGEWITVSQFLEIALIPNEDYSCFNVNGKLLCDGISIAIHRQNFNKSQPIARKAWRIFSEVRRRGGFPLVLEVDDSKVVAINTRNGDDLLEHIVPLTDQTLHGFLIEVGFASQVPAKGIDWTINSQLNEGCGGLHIALGTGVDAAHIDFISSNARVLNETECLTGQ